MLLFNFNKIKVDLIFDEDDFKKIMLCLNSVFEEYMDDNFLIDLLLIMLK